MRPYHLAAALRAIHGVQVSVRSAESDDRARLIYDDGRRRRDLRGGRVHSTRVAEPSVCHTQTPSRTSNRRLGSIQRGGSSSGVHQRSIPGFICKANSWPWPDCPPPLVTYRRFRVASRTVPRWMGSGLSFTFHRLHPVALVRGSSRHTALASLQLLSSPSPTAYT